MATSEHSRPTDRNAFHIAIICALTIESDAVEALFDEFWEEDEQYGKALGDPNSYTLGRIAQHNVVLAYMPGMGKGASASLAASFRSSFPYITLGLVVGICGGVPYGESQGDDVILGDVVVSTGVVQFDFGRQFSDRLVRKDTLQGNIGRPNPEIQAFLNKMQGWRARTELRKRISEYVADICNQAGLEGWRYPGLKEDKLYQASYRHKHQDATVCSVCAHSTGDDDAVCDMGLSLSCAEVQCDDRRLVARERIDRLLQSSLNAEQVTEALKPAVHFGLMASGDVVMKSATHRDRIATKESIIAFEMEGAGVWDNFPTVIIKGVCDYADSHKNKRWQRYAAATAAACAKAFLRQWRGFDEARPVIEPSREPSGTRTQELKGPAQEPQEAQQINSFSGTFTSAGRMSVNNSYNSGGGPMYL